MNLRRVLGIARLLAHVAMIDARRKADAADLRRGVPG